MDPSVWEAVFFLLLLKIPIVFVGTIVWKAIKVTPVEPGDPDSVRATAPVPDTPPINSRRPARRNPRGPGSGPPRRPSSQRPSSTRTLGN